MATKESKPTMVIRFDVWHDRRKTNKAEVVKRLTDLLGTRIQDGLLGPGVELVIGPQ